MATSNGSTLLPEVHSSSRGPLRLDLAENPADSRLHGGWWPQSRDLAVELADLVDHFPARFGRVVHVLLSPADWDSVPRRVPVAGGTVRVSPFPSARSHVIQLKTTEHAALHVLVVPPGFSEGQGAEALLAAATPGNSHSAGDLLDEVTEYPKVDPTGHWSDAGGSWWGPDLVPPSFRTTG